MGSSSSGSARAAQAAEDERRRNISATQQQIEGIFGSPQREAGIQDFIGATRDLLQGDLDRTKVINDRELKFALARAGLSGGSSAIDTNQDLSQAFLRGSVDVERQAQGAGADVRSADQAAKLALVSQALGGLDQTTASQNALSALRTNIDTAKNVSSESNFDSFFSRFTSIFKQSREAKARRESSKEFFTPFALPPKKQFSVAGGSS